MSVKKIGGREIGRGKRTLVIAELGVNHNGSLDLALKMVEQVRRAGADAVKIQAYDAEEFCDPKATYTYRQPYISPLAVVCERQVDMFGRYQLDEVAIQAIAEATRNAGMLFIATACSQRWVRLLEDEVDAFKVGSDDMVHLPLLRSLAKTGKPVILSTGMATLDEVSVAVSQLPNLVALLHCVSLYPTPSDKSNLGRMKLLERFGVPVGYSDHTNGNLVSGLAISAGAAVIEKHVTLDKRLPGPDHWFSATPDELEAICKLYDVISNPKEEVSEEERKMAALARRSVVTSHTLIPGTVLQECDISYRRPGTGISPMQVDALLGRTVLREVKAGSQITVEDLFLPDSEGIPN